MWCHHCGSPLPARVGGRRKCEDCKARRRGCRVHGNGVKQRTAKESAAIARNVEKYRALVEARGYIWEG